MFLESHGLSVIIGDGSISKFVDIDSKLPLARLKSSKCVSEKSQLKILHI